MANFVVKGQVLIDKITISAEARKALSGLVIKVDVSEAQDALDALGAKISSIFKPTQSRLSPVVSQIDKMTRSVKRLNTETRKAKEEQSLFYQVLRKASAFRVSTTFINGFFDALNFGRKFLIDFDTQLRDINKILLLSDKSLSTFGRSLISIGKAYNISVTDIAAAAKTAAQAGFFKLNDTEIKRSAKTLELVANAAFISKTTTLDFQQALQSLVVFSSQTGLSVEQTTASLLKLSAIEDASAINTQDLAEAFKRAGTSITQSFGGATNEAFGSIAALIERTQQSGAVVGTFFKTLIARLSGGNREASAAFEELGISLTDKLTGKLKTPFALLTELKAALKGLAPIQVGEKLARVGGVRQIELLKALLDTLPDSIDSVNGRAKELSDVAGKGFARAIEKLQQENKKIEKGFNDIIATYQDLVQKFAQSNLGQSLVDAALQFGNILNDVLSGKSGNWLVDKFAKAVPALAALLGMWITKSLFGAGPLSSMLKKAPILGRAFGIGDKVAAEKETRRAELTQRREMLSGRLEKSAERRQKLLEGKGIQFGGRARNQTLVDEELKIARNNLSRLRADEKSLEGTKDAEQKIKLKQIQTSIKFFAKQERLLLEEKVNADQFARARAARLGTGALAQAGITSKEDLAKLDKVRANIIEQRNKATLQAQQDFFKKSGELQELKKVGGPTGIQIQYEKQLKKNIAIAKGLINKSIQREIDAQNKALRAAEEAEIARVKSDTATTAGMKRRFLRDIQQEFDAKRQALAQKQAKMRASADFRLSAQQGDLETKSMREALAITQRALGGGKFKSWDAVKNEYEAAIKKIQDNATAQLAKINQQLKSIPDKQTSTNRRIIEINRRLNERIKKVTEKLAKAPTASGIATLSVLQARLANLPKVNEDAAAVVAGKAKFILPGDVMSQLSAQAREEAAKKRFRGPGGKFLKKGTAEYDAAVKGYIEDRTKELFKKAQQQLEQQAEAQGLAKEVERLQQPQKGLRSMIGRVGINLKETFKTFKENVTTPLSTTAIGASIVLSQFTDVMYGVNEAVGNAFQTFASLSSMGLKFAGVMTLLVDASKTLISTFRLVAAEKNAGLTGEEQTAEILQLIKDFGENSLINAAIVKITNLFSRAKGGDSAVVLNITKEEIDERRKADEALSRFTAVVKDAANILEARVVKLETPEEQRRAEDIGKTVGAQLNELVGAVLKKIEAGKGVETIAPLIQSGLREFLVSNENRRLFATEEFRKGLPEEIRIAVAQATRGKTQGQIEMINFSKVIAEAMIDFANSMKQIEFVPQDLNEAIEGETKLFEIRQRQIEVLRQLLDAEQSFLEFITGDKMAGISEEQKAVQDLFRIQQNYAKKTSVTIAEKNAENLVNKFRADNQNIDNLVSSITSGFERLSGISSQLQIPTRIGPTFFGKGEKPSVSLIDDAIQMIQSISERASGAAAADTAALRKELEEKVRRLTYAPEQAVEEINRKIAIQRSQMPSGYTGSPTQDEETRKAIKVEIARLEEERSVAQAQLQEIRKVAAIQALALQGAATGVTESEVEALSDKLIKQLESLKKITEELNKTDIKMISNAEELLKAFNEIKADDIDALYEVINRFPDILAITEEGTKIQNTLTSQMVDRTKQMLQSEQKRLELVRAQFAEEQKQSEEKIQALSGLTAARQELERDMSPNMSEFDKSIQSATQKFTAMSDRRRISESNIQADFQNLYKTVVDGLKFAIAESQVNLVSLQDKQKKKIATKEESDSIIRLSNSISAMKQGLSELENGDFTNFPIILNKLKEIEVTRINGLEEEVRAILEYRQTTRKAIDDLLNLAERAMDVANSARDAANALQEAQFGLDDSIEGKLKESSERIGQMLQGVGDAMGGLISARAQLASAISAGSDAFAEYKKGIMLAAYEVDILNGKFNGTREQSIALAQAYQQIIDSAIMAGASEKQIAELRMSLAQEQLSMFQNMLSNARSRAEKWFTSSAQERADFMRGLQGIQQLLKGGVSAAEILSIPQEMRQQMLAALETMPEGATINGLTRDEVKNQLMAAVYGKSARIESLPSIMKTVADYTMKVAELNNQQLSSSKESVAAAYQSVTAAKEQVQIAKDNYYQAMSDAVKLQEGIALVKDSIDSRISEANSQLGMKLEMIRLSGADSATKQLAQQQAQIEATNRIAEIIRTGAGQISSLTPETKIRVGDSAISTGGPALTILNDSLKKASEQFNKLSIDSEERFNSIGEKFEKAINTLKEFSDSFKQSNEKNQKQEIKPEVFDRMQETLEQMLRRETDNAIAEAVIKIDNNQKVTVTGAAEMAETIVNKIKEKGFVMQGDIDSLMVTISNMIQELVSKNILAPNFSLPIGLPR